MTKIRVESFVFLIILGFFCVANSNPITSLFGKSSDDKAEADGKSVINTASIAKAGETAATTTTTTIEPGSSCGGLKGFLHICEKNDPAEPPKSVKKRSVSDDDSDDSKSDEDSDESEEKPVANEESEKITETSSNVSEATVGKISKRQVGDPGAPILGEVPPVLSDAMEAPEEPADDDDDDVKKRQVDDSDSDSDSDDSEREEKRQRRDCRGNDDDGKDCRKKREYVPSCFGKNCRSS